MLEVVGRDAVSFRRNAKVAINRARDICDAINTHIHTHRDTYTQGPETENGIDLDWISFSKYSDVIDPVEE